LGPNCIARFDAVITVGCLCKYCGYILIDMFSV